MEREEESVEFKKDLVSKLLRMHLEEKTRVRGDALLLLMELLKVFVHETAHRAARQAQSEDVSVVNIEHVEKILPQLLIPAAAKTNIPGEVWLSPPVTTF